MKVWGVFISDGDGCTWSIYELDSLFTTQEGAARCKLRLEETAGEFQSPEFQVYVEELEVNE